jgi:hypothetical protein
MRYTISTLLIASLLLSCTEVALAADGEVVGGFGDSRSLLIEGCRSLKVEQVRKAIAGDLQLQIASTPSAPLDKYIRLLRERVMVGCRRAGLPEAGVTVTRRPSDKRLLLHITEGDHYTCGKIEIKAPPAIDTKGLIKALTAIDRTPQFPVTVATDGNAVKVGAWRRKKPDADARAVWVAGKPAAFDAIALRWIGKTSTRH